MADKKINLFKNYFLEINNFTLIVFLFSYVFLLVVEDTSDKFISLFFNYNIFLYICIITGLIMLIFERGEQELRLIKSDYVLIISLALTGFVVILMKTKQLGWLGLVISVIFGLLIYVSSLVLLRD
jgi:hypothetical protein